MPLNSRSGVFYLTKEERLALLSDHGHKCDYCGKPHERLACHHHDYHEKPNTVLCPACHRRLHRELPAIPNQPGSINVKLPKDLILSLRQTAKREDRKVRVIVERALRAYIRFSEFSAPNGKKGN